MKCRGLHWIGSYSSIVSSNSKTFIGGLNCKTTPLTPPCTYVFLGQYTKILKPTETFCFCPEKPVVDNYLLVSVVRPNSEAQHIRPQIYQIDLTTGHSKPLLRTDPTIPGALAIDAKKQVLYYVDRGIAMIGSVSLQQGNSSMRVIYRDPTCESIDQSNQTIVCLA